MWKKFSIFLVTVLSSSGLCAPCLAQDTEAVPLSYSLRDVSIRLERTPCYGTCPAYAVEVRGDGKVVYEGKNFVRINGRQETELSEEKVVALLQKLYDIHFFDLRNEYQDRQVVMLKDGQVSFRRQSITDMPSQIVTVRIGDYEKRVVDYQGAPKVLQELESAIDDTTNSSQWTKQGNGFRESKSGK